MESREVKSPAKRRLGIERLPKVLAMASRRGRLENPDRWRNPDTRPRLLGLGLHRGINPTPSSPNIGLPKDQRFRSNSVSF